MLLHQNVTGLRLKELRVRFKISRRKVADLLSISDATIIRAERIAGHKIHPLILKRLERLIEILELKADAEDRAKGKTDE
jgi:transcriptional regulator with XRE-family HTH domain